MRVFFYFYFVVLLGFCFVLNACDVLVGDPRYSVDMEGSLALPVSQSWVKQDGGAWPPMVAV